MPEFDSIEDVFAGCADDLHTAVLQAPIPGLGDGPIDNNLCQLLGGRKPSLLLDAIPENRRQECLSGLWLLAGDIDRSHTISQDLPSAEGSFLHGIMHRREGDFGNAKYWFRRVGPHEVLTKIADHAGRIYRDPFEFIDSCSRVAGGASELAGECRQAQWIEWQLLMAYLIDG